VVWPNLSADRAEFAGTAGTVTVTTPITVAGLIFGTTGYTLTGANAVSVGFFGIDCSALSSGTTTISAPITLTTSSQSVNVASGATLSISGSLGGSEAISLPGAGTVILGGNNNYSGGTTVNAGNLRLTNSSGSAIGGGALNVSGATATVSGTGTASGGLATFASSAIIAPGINSTGAGGNFGSAGTLTLGAGAGGLTLTNADFDFDLANTSTVGSGVNDLLDTSGTLTFGTLAFTFDELSGSLLTGTPYTLIAGATSESGFNTSNISTTFNGVTYTPTYTFDTTNGLRVTFGPVPEPPAWLLAGMGLILAVMRFGRKGLRT